MIFVVNENDVFLFFFFGLYGVMNYPLKQVIHFGYFNTQSTYIKDLPD